MVENQLKFRKHASRGHSVCELKEVGSWVVLSQFLESDFEEQSLRGQPGVGCQAAVFTRVWGES